MIRTAAGSFWRAILREPTGCLALVFVRFSQETPSSRRGLAFVPLLGSGGHGLLDYPILRPLYRFRTQHGRWSGARDYSREYLALRLYGIVWVRAFAGCRVRVSGVCADKGPPAAAAQLVLDRCCVR